MGLVVVLAGCFSGPATVTQSPSTASPNGTTPTDQASTLPVSEYPSFVSDTAVVVVPSDHGVALNRSVTVLRSHLTEVTGDSPAVVTQSQFDPDNRSGTAVVLAPDGHLPATLDGTVDAPASANETTATILATERRNASVDNLVVLSGGVWGIRAGVDALAGRTNVSLSGDRATVDARIDTYDGEVVRDRYADLYTQLFVTDDNTYVLRATPASLERDIPVNATVRAYRTQFRVPTVGGDINETSTLTGPALEIVSVSERDDS